MPLAQFKVVIDQPVAWGDMDSFGHVNNVVYFRYFENARVEYFRRIGWWDSMAATRPDEASLQDLQTEAEELRKKINRFRTSLGRFFVQKQELIDIMTLAAIAQEPLLLVGPPGTAKSDLVLKFKDALGVSDEDYFEYMLTRFTEPSEIIGAIDIGKLRDGSYIRPKQGKLPTARIAFLDEIFKSNSAILNILLTIINEKKFYQDGMPEAVSFRILYAANNEIPEHGEPSALQGR